MAYIFDMEIYWFPNTPHPTGTRGLSFHLDNFGIGYSDLGHSCDFYLNISDHLHVFWFATPHKNCNIFDNPRVVVVYRM